MAKNNVLILSAGRRVELVESFRLELKKRGMPSKLLCADLRPELSAACHIADISFVLPRVTHSEYVDKILEICQANDVGLVIPTIDTELLALAKARTRFLDEGVHVVISNESLVRQCRDKRETASLFRSLEIDIPEIYTNSELKFPCFAKPYDGSRSVGAMLLRSEEALTTEVMANSKMMFMEYMDSSFSEFTVDIYYDRNGALCCLVPRQRLEVRDGEVSKAITRKGFVYEYLIERLKKVEGARGCLTMQLFARNDPRRFGALEINPRFGGGYPLSYRAGANYTGWLIDEYMLNKKVCFFDAWRENLLMLRYDASVIVQNAIV